MTENSKCINDFPKEVVKNQFILLEDKGTENENILGAYNSEIEAFKIYKRVSHNDKIIVKANAVYADIYGMKVLCDYEEI